MDVWYVGSSALSSDGLYWKSEQIDVENPWYGRAGLYRYTPAGRGLSGAAAAGVADGTEALLALPCVIVRWWREVAVPVYCALLSMYVPTDSRSQRNGISGVQAQLWNAWVSAYELV